MRFGKAEWNSWERGAEREWLLTNGIGGFSSSTITGGNTRRYHGLLVAALKPPVQRHLILSQLHETIFTGKQPYQLHAFSTGDFVMRGFQYLQSFEMDPLPEFIYRIGDILVEKTITMVYGENTVAVVYRIRSGAEKLLLRVTPLVNFRDYHGDSHKSSMRFEQENSKDSTRIKPYGSGPEILLGCLESSYIPAENCWFEHMHYAAEQERGLHAEEDHYIPGSFDIACEAWCDKTFTFLCTVEKEYMDGIGKRWNSVDGCCLIDAEKARLKALTDRAGFEDEFACALVRAADQFIAYRQSTNAKTILAGFPWFTDWGRDAMISLCGLTLPTGRFEDAAQILCTFASYVRYGLIPNMFPDEGGDPGYNTVDAALWYFEAVWKYLCYTGNVELVNRKLYPSLARICEAFQAGTLHHIHMEEDGLIAAGDAGTQLTWMDAQMGSTVFTPRNGKAVEINALWYNALRVMEMLAPQNGDDSEKFSALAKRVKAGFIRTFWNEKKECLYDVVNGVFNDESIRPNQILAVSLSYPILEGMQARCVVEKVWKELYTPYGLRSLSPESPEYKDQCTGDQYARDSAYHQGTVWAWLIGPFVTAFSRTFGKEPGFADLTAGFLDPFRDHLRHACLGSISEIFDGNALLTPRGCCAQAWSVAEVLRAYAEEVLHIGPSTQGKPEDYMPRH